MAYHDAPLPHLVLKIKSLRDFTKHSKKSYQIKKLWWGEWGTVG